MIAKQKGWICALMDDRRDAENEKTGSRNEKRKSGQLDASSFPSSPSARLFLLVYKPRPFHHHLPPAPAAPPLASLYGPHGSAARPSYPKNGVLSNPASLVAYHSYQKLTLKEFSVSFGMLYTVNCRLYWLCWSMLLFCCGHITRKSWSSPAGISWS